MSHRSNWKKGSIPSSEIQLTVTLKDLLFNVQLLPSLRARVEVEVRVVRGGEGRYSNVLKHLGKPSPF